jgi:hypothetical protein
MLNGEEGSLRWSSAGRTIIDRHCDRIAYQFSKPTRHVQPPDDRLPSYLRKLRRPGRESIW